MAAACQSVAPADADGDAPVVDVAWLKAFARRFMEDMHEACNIWRHEDRVVPEQATYNLALRQFRRARPWLRENLAGSDDRLDLLTTPTTTIFYGLRRAPLQGKLPPPPPAEAQRWPWSPIWAGRRWPSACRSCSRIRPPAGRCCWALRGWRSRTPSWPERRSPWKTARPCSWSPCEAA